MYYLACLLEGGDLKSVCRRLLVIASEDIGLAYPNAIAIVKSCTDAALQVGLPEARINLAQAVLVLATAPKSDSAIQAIDKAAEAVRAGNNGGVPAHLRDSHYSGAAKLGHGVEYRYPHSYPNHYVKQEYLPEGLRGSVFYEPAENRNERAIRGYLAELRRAAEETN